MATPVQFANGPLPQSANTNLTQSIASSGGGTVTVGSATYLPAAGPFIIVVDNERIRIDSISGTTLTFASGGRGLEGTTAAAHSSGASVWQVVTIATLAQHIDDRASKGVIFLGQQSSNVTLSTTAGTYSDIVVSGSLAVTGGRRYRIMTSGGNNILAGGSGFATSDTWQQRLQVDEGSGYGDLPLGGSASYVMRLEVAVTTRQPIPVKVAYYEPSADDTVTFRWQMSKTNGASTVTTTVDATSAATPLAMIVEDVGAV